MRGAPDTWMEIELVATDDTVRVSARGSGDRSAPPHSLDSAAVAEIAAFEEGVRAAAMRGAPLGPSLEKAHSLYSAIFQQGTLQLFARLIETRRDEPLLLRLCISDPRLKGAPWEAICEPGTSLGHIGCSPLIVPVRRTGAADKWIPRRVTAAVKVLIIAPEGGASLEAVEYALSDSVACGDVELLPPIVGPATSPEVMFGMLRGQSPNIIHFVGHGRVQNDAPSIKLKSLVGEDTWLPVELFGQELFASFSTHLRLVVLESCEGAAPGAFGSAAEILTKRGVDAVIAYLWPVRMDLAQRLSHLYYGSLTGRGEGSGDVARSLNDARRALLGSFEQSAEAFSPVLSLRAPTPLLFNFADRKPPRPKDRASALPGERRSRVDGLSALGSKKTTLAPLAALLEKPFSLLIGDQLEELSKSLLAFRDKLHAELSRMAAPSSQDLPVFTLAQRYEMHSEPEELAMMFQQMFPVSEGVPLARALARCLPPGVHTSLLRAPWLEQAVAREQPERTIYVLHLTRRGKILTMERPAHRTEWTSRRAPPDVLDPSEEIVILRLYGGYTPQSSFMAPLLTEDDYPTGLRAIEAALPRDLANTILATFDRRPALILGMSLYTPQHRMLLERVYPRGISKDSIAIVPSSSNEQGLWQRGAGLPGKEEGITALGMTSNELLEALSGLAP